jgi:hypothetical protein
MPKRQRGRFFKDTYARNREYFNVIPKPIRKAVNQGIGKNPSKGGYDKDKHDCHVWLEDENGKIIDPTPKAYPLKMEYRPFDKTEQVRIWNSISKDIRALGKEERKVLKKELYKKPQDRCCGYNVFAYWAKNKHLKIVIGSAGFHLPAVVAHNHSDKGTNVFFTTHQIFWEFG